MFQRNTPYKRTYISEILGGGIMDYLPHANGRVTYGAFDKKLNPDAPSIVLPGTGEEIERWARVLSEQVGPIPIFIKKRSNEWFYYGEYKCVDLSEKPTDIAPHASKTRRDDITMVLRLERVRESASAAL